MIEKYNLVHLSTGDLLRKELETNSKLGQLAKNYMNKGGLVPDDIILGMVAKELDANKGTKGVVLDGFPRTVDQAKGLEKILKDRNYEVSAMFALNVRKNELVKRLLERAKQGNRIDDTPDIIEERIKTYIDQTAPVGEYFRKKGKLYEIMGEGKIEDIFEDISEVIEKLIKS
ncbi:MAG: nucleoside monophosphate kinase [Bacteroidales bacterium]|nr:nucleoside monophosphate kinase [Bacteroidales bacterium]